MRPKAKLIGLDLDNTLACYDRIFHDAAARRGLIPADLPAGKERVKEHLRGRGREDAWTELQGHVYGPAMADVPPFPGALDFLRACRDQSVAVRIVSHRTARPFLGPPYDLHEFARRWLQARDLVGAATGLTQADVYLETTKLEKLRRIEALGCTHFIDDLPEFLQDPAFPKGVERLLFDPNGLHRGGALERASCWEEIASRLLRGGPRLEPDWLPKAASALLASQGVRGTPRLVALAGAANNRVYRLEAGASHWFLKAYFRHVGDPRDRLDAEYGFMTYAWGIGARCLPRPLAADAEHGLGLYEYVEGRRLEPGEADAGAVGEALGLFSEINRRRDAPEAGALPPASEACFSLEEHLALVDARVRALRGIGGTSPLESEAAEFARTEISRAWVAVGRRAREEAVRAGISPSETLAAARRCLSPSDFGFHNALRGADGRLRFVDFEYAGWDDPAKTVCDFFCQQAVPVPEGHWDAFAEGVAEAIGGAETPLRRMRLLLPVYRVKWCCILLNDFLPVGLERRRFAGTSSGELESARPTRLRRARALLERAEAGAGRP